MDRRHGGATQRTKRGNGQAANALGVKANGVFEWAGAIVGVRSLSGPFGTAIQTGLTTVLVLQSYAVSPGSLPTGSNIPEPFREPEQQRVKTSRFLPRPDFSAG